MSMISAVFNCHYDVFVWERKWGVWKYSLNQRLWLSVWLED